MSSVAVLSNYTPRHEYKYTLEDQFHFEFFAHRIIQSSPRGRSRRRRSLRGSMLLCFRRGLSRHTLSPSCPSTCPRCSPRHRNNSCHSHRYQIHMVDYKLLYYVGQIKVGVSGCMSIASPPASPIFSTYTLLVPKPINILRFSMPHAETGNDALYVVCVCGDGVYMCCGCV